MSLPVSGGEKLLAADVNKLGPFGDYATKSNATVYEAETDGFVIARTNNTYKAQILCDSSNPPTTERAAAMARHNDGSEPNSMTVPVKRGLYWKTVNCDQVFWMPVGS